MVKLGDVCEIKHGYAFKGKFFSDEPTNYLLLTPGNFAIGGGFQEKPKYYSGEILENYVLNKEDLIVTMTDLSKQGDTLGYSALVPLDNKYLHNQRIGLVSITDSCVLKDYIYWLMRTRDYQKYIVNHASGSTVKHTSPKSILSYEFDLPDLETQRTIAATLSALDDKIAVNTKINHNLEYMAQVIFKSWFVDFEPWGGVMPDDWCIKKIGDLCQSISKTHSRKKDELIFLNTGDIDRGLFLHSTYRTVCDMPGQAKKSIAKNDILYSEIRPINKHYAYVSFEAEDYVVSTKLMVIRTTGIDSRRLYQYLTSDDVIAELQVEAESRSGTFPQIRFENIQNLEIIMATPKIENQFSTILHSIYNTIDINNADSTQLMVLRDNLLPKLMSGELSISG